MNAVPTNAAPTEPTSPQANQQAANLQSVGILIASVLLAAAGQLIFKLALNGIGTLELSVDGLLKLFTAPLFWIGLVIYGASAFTWLLALMKADLSFAYPFLSISYIFVTLAGIFILQERVLMPRLVGVAIIVVGLFIVARAEQHKKKNG
jgi:drug/metabolite transporter (DMT)-like permease